MMSHSERLVYLHREFPLPPRTFKVIENAPLCNGCAGHNDFKLCRALPDCMSGEELPISFVEIK